MEASRPISLLYALMLFSGHDAVAQVTELKSYNGDTVNWGRRIAQTWDGGFVIASTYRFEPTQFRTCLTKLNTMGNYQWSKKYGTFSGGMDPAVISLASGGMLLLTQTPGTVFDGQDLLVLRLNNNGDTLWTRAYDQFYGIYGADAVELPNGDLVLAANTATTFSLTRVDSNGNVIWSNGYTAAGFSGSVSMAVDVMLTSDNKIVGCGSVKAQGGTLGDAFLIKTDLNGAFAWAKFLGTAEVDMFNRVVEITGGDYLLTGSIGYDMLNWDPQTIAARITSDGTLIWLRTFGAAQYEQCLILKALPDGNYLIGGSIQAASSELQGVLFKISGSGDLIWSNAYAVGPGWSNIGFYDALVVNEGLRIATSMAENFGHDPGLMKQDTIGSPVCVIASVPRIVADTVLSESDALNMVNGVTMFQTAQPVFTGSLSQLMHCFTTDIADTDHTPDEIRLWPNPAQELLIVQLPAPTRARIIDATGRLLRDVMLPAGGASVPLIGLVAGTYSLRLGTGQVLRFVKE